VKSGVFYNGTWKTKSNNGVREFEIKFESDVLKKLDEDWKVFEFNNSQLRFRKMMAIQITIICISKRIINNKLLTLKINIL